MFSTLRAKLRRGEGASAVEYAILIAAIAAIIVAVVFMLGGRVKSAFSITNACIGAEGSGTSCGGTTSGGSSGNSNGGSSGTSNGGSSGNSNGGSSGNSNGGSSGNSNGGSSGNSNGGSSGNSNGGSNGGNDCHWSKGKWVCD